MTEFIHLIGAEDVRKAASTISQAAQTMQSVASQMDATATNLKQYLEEWYYRLDDLIHRTDK